MLLLLSIFNIVNSQTAACSTYGSPACSASGYCYYTGSSCITAECHKVTEVRACRSTGAIYSTCIEITSPDPNYQNVCMMADQTQLMYAFIRYPTDITQTSSTSTQGGYLATTIMNAKYTAQYKYEVLTLQILTATAAQLTNIMTSYIQVQYDLCDNEINPSFMEKAIYESMQVIRDDMTLTLKSGTATKQAYYTLLWQLTAAYFTKMRVYAQQYYTSNKFLINFGFTNLNRLLISLSTQQQTTTITWTTYTANGYLELLMAPAEQFGIINALSDVIIIRPTNLNGDDATLSIAISWTWTYSGTQPTTSSYFYAIDKVQMTIGSQKSSSCNTSTKICTMSTAAITGSVAYVLMATTSISQPCSSRTYARCRLGPCTWSGTSCS